MKEKYLCDGRTFKSYDEVLTFCQQQQYRVTNTQTLRPGVYLITVQGIGYLCKAN